MIGLRVLVCGGRDYANKTKVFAELNKFDTQRARIGTIITGAHWAGADDLAKQWAQEFSRQVEPYPALWFRYGQPAGRIRNSHMVKESRADYVMAFHGGKGTADCMTKASKAGIPVIRIT